MYQKQRMLHDAILFATESHAGQKRRGTEIDYICHPMEVLALVTLASPRNVELQIAAVLHDVVEDCGVSFEEIRHRFGETVAAYVAFVTDDKCRTRQQNKEILIDALKTAPADQCILKCADAVSNLRSMAWDLRALGDGLWERFHGTKEDIHRYYRGMLLAMKELRNHAATKALFDEGRVLYEEIFGEPLFPGQWY